MIYLLASIIWENGSKKTNHWNTKSNIDFFPDVGNGEVYQCDYTRADKKEHLTWTLLVLGLNWDDFYLVMIWSKGIRLAEVSNDFTSSQEASMEIDSRNPSVTTMNDRIWLW